MSHRTRTRPAGAWARAALLCAAGLAAPALASGPAPAPAPTATAPAPICGGDPACTEVAAFAMTVVEFRASLQGYWKVLTVTLRFRNKVDRPVVLGYVQGSGGATDDKGNRYLVKDSDVRGIGFIAPRPDDKFQIAPGQTGDARFTLVWNGQQLFGNTFDLDLTVREILPAGNGQSTLGAEYPLQVSGLVDGAKAASPAVATASGPAAAGQTPPATDPSSTGTAGAPAQGGFPAPFPPPSPTAPSPTSPGTAAAAHCAPGSSCQDLGAFSATLVGTATAVSGKNQLVRLSVRLKNQTAQPLVLAYKADTAGAVDEQGSAFTWGRPGAHDASAQGIGTIEAGRIDARFRLAPGATADAQFVLTHLDAGPRPPGRSFSLNAVLVELRAASGGQQWQVGREYPLRLPAPGAGATPAAAQVPASDGMQKAGDLLKGLFGGK